MDTRKSPYLEVIRDAERIVYREKWRICEDRAAEQLADTSSLRWTRLFPESPVIQVVAIDGVVVGRVRHNGGRWIATETASGLRSQIATPSAPPSWPWPAKRSPGESGESEPSKLVVVAGHARAAVAVIAVDGDQGGHHLAGHQPLLTGEFVDHIERFGDIVRGVDDDGDRRDMAGELK
jgi:hypothetical protein